MKKDTQLKCQVCGEPVIGSLTYWCCSTSKYHYWQWRTDRLRKARQEWERTRTPYQREVLGTFKSDQERAQFLVQHTPTYPAGPDTNGGRASDQHADIIPFRGHQSPEGEKGNVDDDNNCFKRVGGTLHYCLDCWYQVIKVSRFIQPKQVRSLSNKSALNNIAP